MNPAGEYKESFKEDFLDLNSPDLSEPENYVEICCPKCDSAIPADDLNIDDKIGKCTSCNIVFPFEKEIASLKNEHRKTSQRILRPEGIEMFHFNDELELSFKSAFSMIEQIMLFAIPFFSFSIVGMLSESGIAGILMFSPVFISFLAAFLYFIIRKRQVKYIMVNSNEVLSLIHI